ncbi:hypothetical protein [Bifidobacterium indicum]|uniref:hypothetical protein n=1 Tax=Bifidobacterium indicum TaxID=1691 RepID=UPI0030DA7D47
MTGALSGRESPEELYRMALDPEYWDRIGELAASPAAWPDFGRWAEKAVQLGPELAGEPPEPPARSRSIWPFRRRRPGTPPAPAPDRDAETTRILPVTVPAVEPAVAEGERPRRALRGVARGLARPVAFILAAILMAGVGYIAVTHTVRLGEGRTARIERARRHEGAVRLAASRKDAEDLLKRVAASPVAGDDALARPQVQVRQALDDTRGADRAGRIEQARARLAKVWGSLMDARAKETAKTLKVLVARADDLGSAPDSADHRSMTDLAGAWRGRRVGRGNLAKALKAKDDLDRLAASVEADRDRQARERAEAEAREKAQAEPQPQPGRPLQEYQAPPPAPVAPRRQAGQNNAPPAGGGTGQGGGGPSWSVPTPSGPDTGLPGRDPGL